MESVSFKVRQNCEQLRKTLYTISDQIFWNLGRIFVDENFWQISIDQHGISLPVLWQKAEFIPWQSIEAVDLTQLSKTPDPTWTNLAQKLSLPNSDNFFMILLKPDTIVRLNEYRCLFKVSLPATNVVRFNSVEKSESQALKSLLSELATSHQVQNTIIAIES